MNLALTENRSNPRQLMIFKYESLIGNPKLIINNICDFLGESYEDEILPIEQPNSWKIDAYLFSEIKESTKNWNDFIDQAEARLIEDRLSEIMHQLDYPKYTLANTNEGIG